MKYLRESFLIGPWHHKAITTIFLTGHFSMLSAYGIFPASICGHA
ncbi:Hypothetical cytosolic protein [Lacticaseibacillus paracasei]|nr:Hypothetical cytosolic protein [Lacticaseibacillus paracasei]